MNWEELENGQKVKVLEDIIYFDTKSLMLSDDHDIYLTPSKLNTGITIAVAGDIGIWDSISQSLDFTKLTEDGIEINNSLNFDSVYEEYSEINEEIFEVYLGDENGTI